MTIDDLRKSIAEAEETPGSDNRVISIPVHELSKLMAEITAIEDGVQIAELRDYKAAADTVASEIRGLRNQLDESREAPGLEVRGYQDRAEAIRSELREREDQVERLMQERDEMNIKAEDCRSYALTLAHHINTARTNLAAPSQFVAFAQRVSAQPWFDGWDYSPAEFCPHCPNRTAGVVCEQCAADRKPGGRYHEEPPPTLKPDPQLYARPSDVDELEADEMAAQAGALPAPFHPPEFYDDDDPCAAETSARVEVKDIAEALRCAGYDQINISFSITPTPEE